MVSAGLGAGSLSGKSALGGSLSDRRGCYAFGAEPELVCIDCCPCHDCILTMRPFSQKLSVFDTLGVSCSFSGMEKEPCFAFFGRTANSPMHILKTIGNSDCTICSKNGSYKEGFKTGGLSLCNYKKCYPKSNSKQTHRHRAFSSEHKPPC